MSNEEKIAITEAADIQLPRWKIYTQFRKSEDCGVNVENVPTDFHFSHETLYSGRLLHND